MPANRVSTHSCFLDWAEAFVSIPQPLLLPTSLFWLPREILSCQALQFLPGTLICESERAWGGGEAGGSGSAGWGGEIHGWVCCSLAPKRGCWPREPRHQFPCELVSFPLGFVVVLLFLHQWVTLPAPLLFPSQSPPTPILQSEGRRPLPEGTPRGGAHFRGWVLWGWESYGKVWGERWGRGSLTERAVGGEEEGQWLLWARAGSENRAGCE